ncbi:hypothetical protein IKW75_03205 [Candidatus Saccharibacteria bacterium]|nr:hypothetical protein [Candidatus Saccharibacteria bacterium]
MTSEGLYVGSGEARRFVAKSKLKKSSFWKLTPIATLIILVVVAIVAIFASGTLLGPHISELITAATQSDYTAISILSNEHIINMLNGQEKMPDSLKTNLEREGIKVIDDKTFEYEGTTITSENFMSMYNGNVAFREAIIYARGGRAALFYDDTAKTFYEKLGLSRDVLHDYKTTGDETTDEQTYTDLMTKYFDVNSDTAINTAETTTSTDNSGKQTTTTSATGAAISSSSVSGSDAKERAKTFLDSVGDKVAGTSEGCAAQKVGDMVATAVASNAKYTYAQSFMTKMESISKSMAGNGDSSGINSVLNWFTGVSTSKVYNPSTGEVTEVTGSPLESEAMKNILSGTPINQDKTAAYSLERSFSSTDTSIKNANYSTESCATELAGDTVISLDASAIPGSSFIRSTIGTLLQTTLGDGIKISASTTLSLLIPEVADVMYSNAYTSSTGISGGEEFGMGAANINQLASQQNSGATGASREKVLAYNKATDQVIAEEAEIDRKNHSPFDASNPNTFLGSIVSSVLPLATASNTVTAPLSTLTSVSNTSLASLNSTYADGENTSFLTTFGNNCDKIEAIGAAGNTFCNMIAISDLSTSESDPEYQRVISESVEIDANGNEVVKNGSPLADFITYWTSRYSMPGVYDANIANACKENLSGNIPIISDIVAMVSSIDDEYCRSVADGSRYINSSDNPYWDTEKYHQLWVLNTRVKEILGFYENTTNPLTAYREHYDSEHPLDNSRSGYLARISGLTKEDSETVLALFDYYNYVANYNPSERYNFVSPNEERINLENNTVAYYIVSKKHFLNTRREELIG